MNKILPLVCVVLLVLTCFFLFFKPVEVGDIGWHIKAGEWMYQQRSLPKVDPFYFKENAPVWISHSWLGTLSYYFIYAASGEAGLKVFRLLVILGALSLFAFYARRKMPMSLLLLLITVMAFGISHRALLRPLLFNYLFIQLLLIIVLSGLKDSRSRVFWWVPLLAVIWYNFHAAALVHGGLILGAVLCGLALEIVLAKADKTSASDAGDLIGPFRITVVAAGLMLGSFLLNPYGLEGFMYPFKVFWDPSYFNFMENTKFVDELQPPKYLLTFNGLWFYLLAAAATACVYINQKNRLTYILLFVGTLAAFLYGARMLILFVLVSAYVIVSCSANFSLKEKWDEKRWGTSVLVLLAVFLALFCLGSSRKGVYVDGRFQKVVSLDYAVANPNEAVEFLKNHGIGGPVLVNDLIGGQVLWKGFPQLRPIVDGRWTDVNMMKLFIRGALDPEQHFSALHQAGGFDIILLDPSNSTSYLLLPYLKGRPDWRLIYLDGSVVIFVKENAFDLPASLLSFEDSLSRMRLDSEDRSLLRGAAGLAESDDLWSYLFPRISYIDTLEEGIALIELGLKEPGVKRIVDAYREADVRMTRAALRSSFSILGRP